MVCRLSTCWFCGKSSLETGCGIIAVFGLIMGIVIFIWGGRSIDWYDVSETAPVYWVIFVQGQIYIVASLVFSFGV